MAGDIFAGIAAADAERELVAEFRKAALLDGWKMGPLYPGNESAEHAARLEREGFVCFAIARPQERHVGIQMWGPDGLAIKIGLAYPGWEALQAALRVCNYCGKAGVQTFRVGFAGRCCSDCMPEQRRRCEPVGWDR